MLPIELLKAEVVKKKKELETTHSVVTKIEQEIKELEHGILLISTGEVNKAVTPIQTIQPKSNLTEIFVTYCGQKRKIYRQAIIDIMEVISKIQHDSPFKPNKTFKDIIKKYHSDVKNYSNPMAYYLKFLLDKKIIEKKSSQVYMHASKLKDMSPDELQKRIEQERQLQRDVLGR